MLITAVDVVNDISDRRQLGAMMEKAEETLGQRTEMTLADAGYHSGNNLQECALRGQRVVMPESQDRALQSRITKTVHLRRGERQLPLPRGPVAALHSHQVHSQHSNAALPGIRGRVPGLPGLRGLYERQASWACPGDRFPRRCVASTPGLDVHRRSQGCV